VVTEKLGLATDFPFSVRSLGREVMSESHSVTCGAGEVAIIPTLLNINTIKTASVFVKGFLL
jgi:hypothetical protein